MGRAHACAQGDRGVPRGLISSAGGSEPRPLVSAMAFVYTALMLVTLIIALRFVNPTQLVARVRTEDE